MIYYPGSTTGSFMSKQKLRFSKKNFYSKYSIYQNLWLKKTTPIKTLHPPLKSRHKLMWSFSAHHEHKLQLRTGIVIAGQNYYSTKYVNKA